ncbi:hypothetical protein BJ741DRAFT_650928 [Chytriomyces cf. hyalinus JEL632]|nr:hypothetical protein BJ741DRAFT_650928 [Chytriomyces cf. hyalinus JEL632]
MHKNVLPPTSNKPKQLIHKHETTMLAYILPLTAFASLAAAQANSGVTQEQTLSIVNQGLSSLPKCGQTCIAKLPGYVSPVTLEAITRICNNAQTNLNSFVSCTDSTCTGAEISSSRTVAALVPVGCQQLGIKVTATIAPLAKAAATTAAAAAASAPTKGSGAAGVAVMWGLGSAALLFA